MMMIEIRPSDDHEDHIYPLREKLALSGIYPFYYHDEKVALTSKQ